MQIDRMSKELNQIQIVESLPEVEDINGKNSLDGSCVNQEEENYELPLKKICLRRYKLSIIDLILFVIMNIYLY